jgi:hypothetical protein
VTGLRSLIVDVNDSRSLASRARARRMDVLLRTFPDLARMQVLDLGGLAGFWTAAPVHPAHVTIVNLAPAPSPAGWITQHVADACDLPPQLARGFDLVVSNSVLEHVGGHYRRERFAEAVRGAAPWHWVQTPNRHFPIEPHWVFPGQQFLPTAARIWVGLHWKAAHLRATDRAGALRDVLGVELLDAIQLRHYFPDSTLVRERFAGLTKSLIAVAAPPGDSAP